MPDLGGLPGWVSLAIAVLAGLNSLRKVRIDERGGVVSELQELIGTLGKEIDRLNARSEKREAEIRVEVDGLKAELSTSQTDCQKQINTLQTQLAAQIETTTRQANQITQLERRKSARPETEP